MSRIGRTFLALSSLCFLILVVSRFVMGGWQNALWAPFVLTFVFLVLGIAKDIAFYKEVMLMRTTKHGLNLISLVGIVFVILIAVNFIAVQQNKKKDVTSDNLNSLSDQSVSIAKGLQEELDVKGFYKSGTPEEEQEKGQFEAVMRLFQDESSKVKFAVVDPMRNPDVAKEYGVEASGEVVFKYKGKKNSIQEPTEENITNTMIKLTRDKNKVIYVLKGHGEKDTDANDAGGASKAKETLGSASFDVKVLSLLETKEVPADADALLVLGGTQPLLDHEMNAIRDYAMRGGRLFLSLDPGSRSNLGELMKDVGVQFRNNYIIDQFGQMVGASAAMAIGYEYSKAHEITKKFANLMTAFQLASALKKFEGTGAAELKYEEIVKSSPASFGKNEISSKVKMEANDEKGPLPIAVTVEGKFKKGDKTAEKPFAAVVFGDSDFVTNQMLDVQLNRDLFMNAASWLAKEADLISIRPKQAKGTQLQMTETQARLTILGVYLPVPLILFVIGGVLWFRRRNA